MQPHGVGPTSGPQTGVPERTAAEAASPGRGVRTTPSLEQPATSCPRQDETGSESTSKLCFIQSRQCFLSPVSILSLPRGAFPEWEQCLHEDRAGPWEQGLTRKPLGVPGGIGPPAAELTAPREEASAPGVGLAEGEGSGCAHFQPRANLSHLNTCPCYI